MNELELKYGCNPNQKPSRIYMADGSELPIKVLSGRPGYINFLDAFTDMLWNSLNEDNKVSLFVRYIDIATGAYETKIVNKNQ